MFHTAQWMLQIVAWFFRIVEGEVWLQSFIRAFHCNVYTPDMFYAPKYTKCTTHPIWFLRLIGKWNMFVTPNQTYFIQQVPLMRMFMRAIEGVNEIIINMIWSEWGWRGEWDGIDRMWDSSRLDVQSQLLSWTELNWWRQFLFFIHNNHNRSQVSPFKLDTMHDARRHICVCAYLFNGWRTPKAIENAKATERCSDVHYLSQHKGQRYIAQARAKCATLIASLDD